MRKKILYVDVPFYGIHGGDKNRSNFLWKILKENFDADILLLTDVNSSATINEHNCENKTYFLEKTPGRVLNSRAIYEFSKTEMSRFATILRTNQYQLIFFRFISTGLLALEAEKVLPEAQIIVDVDMLFSRIAEMNWQDNHCLKNKYFYFEKMKLKRFEASFFNKKFTFLFTNDYERQLIISRLKLEQKVNYFKVLPNMFQQIDVDSVPELNLGKYILIFGTMNSVANQDGFKFFVEDIYPFVKSQFAESNIKVLVVGKNPLACQYEHEDEILRIVGPVDDINSYIKGAMLVYLPLRIASGTRTRILEAAALKKTILTTTIGAEGFDFSPQEIIIEDNSERIIPKIIDLISKPEECARIGDRLYDKCMQYYEQKVVGQQLIDYVKKTSDTGVYDQSGGKMKTNAGKRICIVTNRFYPEVGGAETNIYYQARMLAETNDVTVICPKRIDKPFLEVMDGITVYRLKDMYNRKNILPNKEAKTLCLDVIGLIYFGNYDVVQVFPALNPNNMLAFFAAKLSKTPIILASFDYLDYATIIKEEGTINPNVLRFHKPSAKQVFFMKRFDHIFAISDKEIEFYKKYNKNVEYSPVPILLEEYKGEKPNPRQKYGITNSEFVYLVLGRVCNVKGQDIALRAFNKVSKEIPSAKLVFVGRTDYEPDFYGEMLKYIRKNELEDKVIFTDMIEREEVLGWLKYSDIHIIPVRFMNSGAVVVESWISGTPVIQSDVVDPNLVVEGKNGYLFPREDSKTCATKMIKAYHERANLKQMAQAGKELVEKKYTYEYLTDLYLRVYDTLKKKK
ncbi:MAG: glycosyltransferase [Candidatus Cloacimonadales bacterium]